MINIEGDFWMTENKRFEAVLNEFDEIEYITDIVDCEDRDFKEFLDYANELAEENEEIKEENKELKLQLEAFKDKLCELECLMWNCMEKDIILD